MSRRALLYFAGEGVGLDDAVRAASALFQSRSGERALWALANPAVVGCFGPRPEPVTLTDGKGDYSVTVEGSNMLLPGHIWVGTLDRHANV